MQKYFATGRGSRWRLLVGFGVVGLLLAGCAGRMTGGGAIPSATNPNGSANFALEYLITNQADGSGRLTGTFHDGAVRLRFDGAESSPAETSGSNCIETTADYVSENQTAAGDGTATVEACDNSGTNLPDVFSLAVLTGPYAGYADEGTLTRGNLTVHGQ